MAIARWKLYLPKLLGVLVVAGISFGVVLLIVTLYAAGVYLPFLGSGRTLTRHEIDVAQLYSYELAWLRWARAAAVAVMAVALTVQAVAADEIEAGVRLPVGTTPAQAAAVALASARWRSLHRPPLIRAGATAATVAAAVEKAKTDRPELFIVDLMMEEVDSGTSLVKELRALGDAVATDLAEH